MARTSGRLAKYLRRAGLLFLGLAAWLWGRDGVQFGPYVPANCAGSTLTLFPLVGRPLVVDLPPHLDCVGFDPDGNSVFAVAVPKRNNDPRNLLRIEFNPTRIRAADAAAPMQGNRSPNGKWVAEREDRSEKLVLRDSQDPTRTRGLGRGGVMKPAWSPDSRYLVLEKWQWRCGVNFDVEVPETLELLDIEKHKRSTIQSSRCQVQHGVNGFVNSEIAR